MAKPKAKSDEEKKAALDQMLSLAATSNHLDTPATPQPDTSSATQPASDTPADLPLQNEEQKGENVPVAPTNEAVTPNAPEPTPTPAPETPTPAQASQPAPTVEPIAAAPEPELAQVAPEVEAIPESTTEPSTAIEVGTVELASLFTPAADKKVFTMRLTDAHYQYLLLLGTVVGNGASPPDIVHNLIAQFIDKNDAQVQKAIAKQLRQRQAKK